jgi:hypothetical protein
MTVVDEICTKNALRITNDWLSEVQYEAPYFGSGDMEAIKKALEKQIAKKPNFEQKGLLGVKMWHCPVCNKEIISDWNKDFANNYCHHCGQRISWEEGGTSD